MPITVMKKGNQVVTELYVKPTGTLQYLYVVCVTFLFVKNQYLSVKLYVLTDLF